MAESGEAGLGRMAEPLEIVAAIEKHFEAGAEAQNKPLAGKHVLITAGPTHEPIDPVRYIANRSSGKQGYAIARAAADLGASVTLVSGPVTLPDPPGVKTVRVESARDMLKATEQALPADAAIFAAAVADWRTADAGEQKLKKDGSGPPQLPLVENPDILATVSKLKAKRPTLVDRLRGGDREGDRARQGETEAQGLRLDRGERRLGGGRRDGRRRQHGAHHFRSRRRVMAVAVEGRRRAAARRADRHRT